MNLRKVVRLGVYCLLSGALSLWLAHPVFSQELNVEQFRNVGSTSHDKGTAVLVDENGNRYVVGYFSGTNVLFGYLKTTLLPSRLSSKGGMDAFVVKYDRDDRVLWARAYGGTDEDAATAIAMDGSGNVWVAGYFSGSVGVGSATITSRGLADVFVVKLSASGALLNYATAGGPGQDIASGVSVDAAGAVWVTGSFMGSCRFPRFPVVAPLSLTSAGGYDIFLARVSGNFWLTAVRAGGIGNDRANGIDSEGSLTYVTGAFGYPSATFGTRTLNSSGGTDIFVAKYDASGNVLWVSKAGGPGDDEGRALTYYVTPDLTAMGGHIIGVMVTGSFTGSARFGSTLLTSAGSTDIFLALFDEGAVFSPMRFGGPGWDVGYYIAWQPSIYSNPDHLVMVGHFEGRASFENVFLTSAGRSDIFVWKQRSTFLQDHPQYASEVGKAGGTGYDFATGVAVDQSGKCYITGQFAATAKFGSFTATSTGLGDMYILRTGSHPSTSWTELVFGTQPSNTPAGTPISPPVTVRVVDARGNTLTMDTRSVTVHVADYVALLNGGGTKQTMGGVATFSDLVIDDVGTGYRLTATAPGTLGAISTPFNITSSPPPATNIVINGSFESGTSPWVYYQNGGAGNVFSVVTTAPIPEGTHKAQITLGATIGTNNQLFQTGLKLDANTAYRISFAHYASRNTSFRINLLEQDEDRTNYGISNVLVSPTTGVETYTLDFTTRNFTGSVIDGQLQFYFVGGSASTTIFLDNVVIAKQGGPPPGALPNLTLYQGAGAVNTYNYNSMTRVLNATASVQNNGTAAAGAFRLGFYLSTDNHITKASDRFVAGVTKTGLAAGANTNGTMPATDLSLLSPALPAGIYYVGMIVDDLSQVAESNEYDTDNSGYFGQTFTYVSSAANPNLITNGGFESGTSPWVYYQNGTGNSFSVVTTAPIPEGTHKAQITLGATIGTNNQLFQSGRTLTANTPYRLTFQHYASRNTTFRISLLEQDEDRTGYGIGNLLVSPTTTVQTYTVDFTPTNFTGAVTDGMLQFLFMGGVASTTIFLDNIVLARRSAPVVADVATPDAPLAMPKEVSLMQNYPNPFNPTTTIRYGLPQSAVVRLAVFNTVGQRVAALVEGVQEAGYHEVHFDASGLASGVYFYRLQAGDFVQSRKLILLR